MYERFRQCELVFDGRVTRGYRVVLEMDDGRLVQRDFFKYPGAAVILPVLDDGSIVLIRNYRFAVDEHLYELPAGMLEPGEDPEVCAARELAEETGYTAGRIEKLTEFYSGPGTTDEKMRVYLATDLEAGAQALEGYETISVETHSDQEVRQMVSNGTIHDAKTIASLGAYWLGKGM